MSRWGSTLYEKVIESHGVKFIQLETGRLISFYDALKEAEAGQRKLWRWTSRINKLASDDIDLERYEWFVDDIEGFVRIHREEIRKRRGSIKIEDRIKLLETMTTERGATLGEQENARRAIETLRRKQHTQSTKETT